MRLAGAKDDHADLQSLQNYPCEVRDFEERVCWSGKEYKGIVGFIAPKANSSLNFPVEIEIPNTQNSLLNAGMYGSINFENSQTEKLTVNRKAFVGSVGSQQVYVMNPDSTAVLRTVTAGIMTEDNVEVIDGLKEGDVVIISGQINLEDGKKVNPIK